MSKEEKFARLRELELKIENTRNQLIVMVTHGHELMSQLTPEEEQEYLLDLGRRMIEKTVQSSSN